MHDREARTGIGTSAGPGASGAGVPGKRTLTGGLPAVQRSPAPGVAASGAAAVVQRRERPDRAESERRDERRDEARDPGTFGTPYSSWAEAAAAEAYLRATLIPSATGMFGLEVGQIWNAYLSRSPGDSLAPRIYAEGASAIAYAFKRCAHIRQEQDALLDQVVANIALAPTLPANEWTKVPLSTFIGATPHQLFTNFSNPYDTPGHIAGGLSGSDAGPDTRWVEGSVNMMRRTDENGATTQIFIQPDFHFRVVDAVDFIPGGAGAGIEQIFTIPLSRLEASGWAYDVPFEVLFTGPATQRTVAGASVAGQYPANPADQQRQERQRDPRTPVERDPRDQPRQREREDSRRRDV
jgi:hypothetical protein